MNLNLNLRFGTWNSKRESMVFLVVGFVLVGLGLFENEDFEEKKLIPKESN